MHSGSELLGSDQVVSRQWIRPGSVMAVVLQWKIIIDCTRLHCVAQGIAIWI